MSKKKLFDEDSEDEKVSFKTENEYAKRYDKWREKEELHKLEQKYGPKGVTSDASGSSDSEDESDEPPEVSEEMETQFLKTLALLKTKDPRIYDPNFKCFDAKEEKKEEEKPAKVPTLTFEDSDDEDSGDGMIFKVEKKAEIDEPQSKEMESKQVGKDGKLKEFLTGKVEHIDQEVEQDLAPLKAFWSDPKLNEGEAFLRDYFLNKRYLEAGDLGDAEDRLRDDEALEEDEKRVEEQGQFERAFNFRFEEPDQEFLKRYPRTMNYTRPKDTRRAEKRAEVKARKEGEKKRKMEDIARLKALKLKEIQEKIAKIKEVTGNQELAFREEDIEGDFDPEEHDRRMKALFDEQFYGEADDQKPVFPDLDDELEIENWDSYEPGQERLQGQGEGAGEGDEGPHCEDDDFNMDADYDPKQAKANLIEEIQSTLVKKRRNRKKKSKLAQLLASEKPKFVPTVADKTYDEYMEEYYKMDCEDVIGGDLPTRFKYREVVPNDYGLSIEEILLADDKELTQWVPLKKVVKHRPRDVERSEVNTYRQKAADVQLKRRILPSLFKDLPQDPEIVVPIEEANKKKKKKKKKKIGKEVEESGDKTEDVLKNNYSNSLGDNVQNGEASPEHKKNKKKQRAEDNENEDALQNNDSNALVDNVQNGEASPELKIKKHKKKNRTESSDSVSERDVKKEVKIEVNNKKKRCKDSNPEVNISNLIALNSSREEKKNKKHRKDSQSNTEDANNKGTTSKHKLKQEEKIASNINTEINIIEKIENNTELKVQPSKNKKKKNKLKSIDFVIENVSKAQPSQTGQKGIQNEQGKVNLKRKMDHQNKVPNKKQKLNSKKQNKNKFKQKNKPTKDATPVNPLTKLSDERLKAYGLNPKKYRSFLKYKKF